MIRGRNKPVEIIITHCKVELNLAKVWDAVKTAKDININSLPEVLYKDDVEIQKN